MVRLVCQPTAGTAAYAVQDQPPSGWFVTNISHGGVFDGGMKRVKFGPFFDSEPRTLSYDVFAPPGFTGVGRFTGQASADGINSLIAGDDRIVIAPPHPADMSARDWAMRIDEVTGYAAAWRTGGVWVLPPNPIPIDYVTRAAVLWRGGELYTFDPTIDTAPLWWVNVGVKSAPERKSLELPGVAVRSAPICYVAGEPVEVRVDVVPAAEIRAYAIEDSVPDGWSVDRVTEGGHFDDAHRQVKWGPYLDATRRTVSYWLTPPAAATGTVTLSGNASFDGTTARIGGITGISSASRLAWTPRPGTGSGALRLSGELGARYLIEISTDLITWRSFSAITNTQGSIEIPISISPDSTRAYYRARLLP
jgi:hypothetical protein